MTAAGERLEVVEDEPAVWRSTAALIADAVRDAAAARGRSSLALSRGSVLCEELVRAGVDWPAVDLFQVDERAAPPDGDDRNHGQIERELLARLEDDGRPIDHPMPVDGDLDAGATAYGRLLEGACGAPPVIDVVHLGIGPDGHTASLVPGDPVLDVADVPVAVTGTYRGYRRMTLTFPVLDRARLVVFAVAGPDKAAALARVLAGDATAPAARVRADVVRFVADRSAAAEVGL